MVGVNTALAGIGLGLAVPIDGATRRIVAALIGEVRVRRAYLGIAGGARPLPPRLAARLGHREVVEVVPDSPAARAGIRPEDLVLGVDGTAIEDAGDVQRLMTDERIGQAVELTVVRAGQERTLAAVPEELRP